MKTLPNRHDINWKGGKPDFANIFGESFDISFQDDVIVSKTESHMWRCKNCGNNFDASIEQIENRHYGCECGGPVFREDYTRFILTQLTGFPFKKVKIFDWLKNKDGNRLQIDCYSEDLNIGCEDNGSIHDRSTNQRILSDEERKRQEEHEEIKRKKCPKYFALFFEIPPEVPKQKDPLTDFIRSELIKNGFGDKILQEKVGWKKFRGKTANKEKLARIVEEFRKKSPHVECLHENYDDRHKPLPWRCGEADHPITPVSVNQARQAIREGRILPCTHCSNKVRITIQEMHAHAKERGGTCKTKKLTDAGNTDVYFDCGVRGHNLHKCTASDVRNFPDRCWCEICKPPPRQRRKITTQMVRILVEEHNHNLHGKYPGKNNLPMEVTCKDCGFLSEYSHREMENKKDSIWCDACKVKARYSPDDGII